MKSNMAEWLTKMRKVLINASLTLKGKYLANNRGAWDMAYQLDYARHMEASAERARNYLIAGVVGDSPSEDMTVLDVGCGVGTLVPLLPSDRVRYLGIDLSQVAIQKCRRQYIMGGNVDFQVASLENFNTDKSFNTVILNEVLYYFRLTQIPAVLRKVSSLLTGGGRLIISMSNCPKGKLLWFLSRFFLPTPTQDFRVSSGWVPGGWTVRVYET